MTIRDIYDNFGNYVAYMEPALYKERRAAWDIIIDAYVHAWDQHKRLSLCVPPRVGKSYITTLFNSWLYLKNPNLSVARLTWGLSLSRKFGMDIKTLIESPRYRKISNLKIDSSVGSKSMWRFSNNTRELNFISASVGSGITGFGFDVMLYDDMIKDYLQAVSPVNNAKLVDWYFSVSRTRLQNSKCEISIGTRWTRNDFQKLFRNNPDVLCLDMPALNEHGESNFPYANSTSELNDIRDMVGDIIFNSVYQQNPDDTVMDRYLTRVDMPIVDIPDSGDIVCAIDPSLGTGNDYIAMVLMLRHNEQYYLIDSIYHNQTKLEDCLFLLLNKLNEYWQKGYVINSICMETNGGYGYAYKLLKQYNETFGRENNITNIDGDYGFTLYGYNEKSNKQVKIANNMHLLRQVHYNKNKMSERQYKALYTNIETWNLSAAHDDGIDATVNALLRWQGIIKSAE